MWDLTDRAQPDQLGKPLTLPGGVGSVAFAPDGRTLATGSFDGTVILWDLSDPPAQPNRLGQPLTVDTGGLYSPVFGPDGCTLATLNDDNDTVVLWDVTDRDRPIQLGDRPIGNTGGVFSVAFPDGRTLVTVGGIVTVISWDLTGLNQTRDHLIERACDLTGGGLTRDDWNRHVPGLPYEETCSGQ